VNLKPLEQGNLSARAYGALREALIAGSFGPGERIVMQDLAIRLGTSVTPVREACLRLVSEQGLEIRSGRFITVPELDLARYLEIRTIRTALEGLAAELAAGLARPADIEHLSAVQRRFEQARLKGDSKVAMEMNREFHLGVYRLCGMDMLVRQIRDDVDLDGTRSSRSTTRTSSPTTSKADEHVRLIQALARRDGASRPRRAGAATSCAAARASCGISEDQHARGSEDQKAGT
jgi:DNA-binding GntR family transcriptional regulator